MEKTVVLNVIVIFGRSLPNWINDDLRLFLKNLINLILSQPIVGRFNRKWFAKCDLCDMCDLCDHTANGFMKYFMKYLEYSISKNIS